MTLLLSSGHFSREKLHRIARWPGKRNDNDRLRWSFLLRELAVHAIDERSDLPVVSIALLRSKLKAPACLKQIHSEVGVLSLETSWNL